jgi:hypothetical protein
MTSINSDYFPLTLALSRRERGLLNESSVCYSLTPALSRRERG